MSLLVIGMTVMGCSAGAAADPHLTAPTDANPGLDAVPLRRLMPTTKAASHGIGVSLDLDRKPESTAGNTASPNPSTG